MAATKADTKANTTIELDVRPMAGAIGAEIHGVDLLHDHSPEIIQAIRDVWLQFGVVVFRDQPLAPAKFQAFAEQFGETVEYPFVKGLDDFPKIMPVLKLPHERNNFGGVWHTDTAYLQTPPMATMLIAREIPPKGGDTLFASGYAAYDALSPGLKHTLEGLTAVNCSAKAEVTKTREDRIADSATAQARETLTGKHPVIRTHPETGRKSLYVNPAHTTHFVGWTEEESASLLAFLYAHQVKPEFTCRISWQPDTIVLWDNRCVLHYPINDYHGYKRLLHRITLKGDTPR
jgi:taurine dioxygenase